jgi:hypothetical protein
MKLNLEKPPITTASGGNQRNSSAIIIVAVIVAAAAIGGYIYNSKNNNLADRDQDGILDNVDRCPDEKGAIEYGGCNTSAEASNTASTPALTATEASEAAAPQAASATQKNSTSTVAVKESAQPQVSDARNAVVDENSMKVTTIETATAPSEPAAKNVSARLKTNSGQNTISWNAELSKAKDLQLSITTASGLNFKKDVSGMSSYTFNPGSGEWQGKKCTVTLTTGDTKIIIDNSKLPNTFFNCSAE